MKMQSLLYVKAIALFFVLLTVSACDDGGIVDEDGDTDTEPVIVVAPTITLSSFEETLIDGSQGIRFFAEADQDLNYKKVTIDLPAPLGVEVYNLNNRYTIEEESIALQAPGIAYYKVAGQWKFEFEVTTGTGNEERAHTVRIDYEIAAKTGSPVGPNTPTSGPIN